jgi:hypothetical protein
MEKKKKKKRGKKEHLDSSWKKLDERTSGGKKSI